MLKPQKVMTNARVDGALRACAEEAAKKENRSLSNLIETALRDYLVDKGYIDEEKTER